MTRENVSPASFQSLNNNKVFFEAFDYNAFQLKGVGNYFEITMNSHFNNPNNSDTTNKDETISQLATAIDSLAQTDSILPEVDIENHMEKSYTADKKLIYSKEIDDDKLAHGKFIEYWPNGELKTKGQYEHGEKKGIWKYYDEQGKFLKKEETKPSLFKMEEPKDKVIIAWYTPEIPVSFGPNNYWGLPGLILEINEDETIILCSKVTLSNKEKSKIKVPNTGDKVTQKKFDEIEKKKMDSMKNEDGVIIFEN